MQTVTDQDDEQRSEDGPSDGTEISDVSEDVTGNPKKLRKHRKLRYNAAYDELLHSPVEEISSGGVEVSEPVLQPSQVGLTLWSSEEKEILFTVLSKKGKDDLKAIAEAIGSKSEPEVHVYLQLLQQMTENQHTSGSDSGIAGSTDVPAAFEVSDACMDLLDTAADAILAKEQELDKEREREVFGDFWLLDASLAEEKEDSTADEGSSRVISDYPQLQHALELFNLDRWLHVSSRVFMNPRDLADNWRSHVDKDETPSIHSSAFINFHNLAIIVTKRLVSSAIFFAKSRLRVTKTKKHGHQNRVRQEDVMAAVDVLGMEPDAMKFWHGVARRCRLDVYESVTIKKCSGQYSLEEVENILTQPDIRDSSDSPSPFEEHAPLSGNEETCAVDSNVQTDDEVSDAIGTREGEDAEILDHQASQEEEERLWKLFHQVAKRPVQADHIHNLPKRQKVATTSEDRVSDWRDFMDYQKPWERHKTPIPLASFVKNSKLYRPKPNVLEPLGNVDDLSTDSDGAVAQDGASPVASGSLDGAVDDIGSDVGRAETESEAGSNDTDNQDEGGPLSSHDEAGTDEPFPVHLDHDMDDADSEEDARHHRGRSS